MAKQNLQNTRARHAAQRLFFPALACALALLPGWAAQRASKPSPGTAKAAQAGAEKSSQAQGRKAGKTPAERKEAVANARASQLGEGRRDPFKLPAEALAVKVSGGIIETAPNGALPPGARGLLIAQLKLEGVEREDASNKMIAVVTNETRRAYFLTENEAVYNGVVSKITPDSIAFTENVLDSEGRATTREVVKRLNPASGEGR